MADVPFSTFVSGLSLDTIGGSEKLPVVDGSTPRHVLIDTIKTYILDAIAAAAGITPTTGDALVVERAGAVRNIDLDALAAYVVATGWGEAAEADPASSGDMLLVERAGTVYKVDVDTLLAYINTVNGTLGEQIEALATATLTDGDEYALSQGGTGAKATFAAIAARVHAQILTYLGTLDPVVSLADANSFYVDQGGTAKRVTAATIAAYILAEIKSALLASAWDDFAALGGAALGTDVFLLERAGVGKTATGANLASYIIGTQDSASAADPAAAGDDFLMFRSGVEYKVDIDVLATYIHNLIWSQLSGNPVVDSDKVAIGRSGDTLTVTALQLQTYILDGIQATVLDLTGLATATITDADLLLVGEGTTGKKATAADLAAYILASIKAAVLASAWDDYAAVASGASGDILLLERAGVGKTIDLDDVAAFCVDSQDGASLADPVASGDGFLMFRSGSQFKVDADVLAEFILAQAWAATSGNPVATGDEVMIGRSGATLSVTVDQLKTFVLTGIQQSVLDFSGLSAATLAATDLFGVWNGTTAEKVALSDLEAKLWADFATFVAALTAVSTLVDADLFYCIQSGVPKKLTADVLASYIDDELWADAAALTPAAAGDGIFVRRSGTSYTMDIDVLAAYVNADMQDTVLDFSGLAPATPGASDEFVVDSSGTPKSLTLADLETKLWADFATFVAALTAVSALSDTDLFYCIQGGTAKKVTPVELAAYVNAAATYETFDVNANRMAACSTNGAASGSTELGNGVNLPYFAFDGGATEERVQFRLTMPEDWDRSDVNIRFLWSSATGSTAGDTVEWGIKAVAISNGDALNATFGTAVTKSDVLLSNNGAALQRTDVVTLIPGGSPALGDFIVFEVYRNTDGTDNMPEDAWLFGVQVQYRKNQTVAEWS